MFELIEYQCPERRIACSLILQALLDARQIIRRNAKYFERNIISRAAADKILECQEKDILEFLTDEFFDRCCMALGLESVEIAAFIHGILSGELSEECEARLAKIIEEAPQGSYKGLLRKCRRRKKSCPLPLPTWT